MITPLGVIIAASMAGSTLLLTGYMAILSRAAERPYAGPPAIAVAASLALSAAALFWPGYVTLLALVLVVASTLVARR